MSQQKSNPPNDMPKLEPGEKIVESSDGKIKTEQHITMYDIQQIRQMQLRQSHARAAQLMGVAVDNIIQIMAREGLVINASTLTEMCYVPVGAAVGLAMQIEGKPTDRSIAAHTALNDTMECIKNARHNVRSHYVKVIRENVHLSPAEQTERNDAIMAAERERAEAIRAQQEAARKSASESLAKAHMQKDSGES